MQSQLYFYTFSFFKIFYYLETGKEGGRQRGRETSVASCTPPTRDLAHNPGMCPDWESNLGPFGSQASAQPTELQQPGLYTFSINNLKAKFRKKCTIASKRILRNKLNKRRTKLIH